MPGRRGNTAFLSAAPRAGTSGQAPKSLVLWEPELGELDLSCDNGYIITSLELGFPEVREVLFEMAYMNGVWDETGYFGSSTVTIGIGLDGAKAPVQFLLDQLRAYVVPARRPKLRYLPNGYTVPRELTLRGADCQAIFDNPRVMSVVAQWVNPLGRAFEYLPDSPTGFRCVLFGFGQPGGRVYNRTHNWVYPPGLTNAVNVQNLGNAVSPWLMTIRGPVETPRVDLTNLGFTFTVDLNRGGPLVLAAGESAHIDSAARTVVDQNGDSLYHKLANAYLPSLPIGQTTLRARATDQTPPAGVEFCYRSAWV